MNESTRAEAIKKLTADGFPIRDTIGQVIAPLVAQYHGDARERIYTPETVIFALITGVIDKNLSLQSAVIRNNSDRELRGLAPASTNTAAFSEMRSKLDMRILSDGCRKMAKEAACQMEDDAFWGNYTPYAIDGTTLTAADTLENQKAFPQHGSQNPGAGYPIIRMVLLQSLRTGMIVDVAYGPFKGKETGEMALARQIFPSLGVNDLLIGDRYFPSFFTMANLMSKGVAAVFQAHASRDVDFRTGKALGPKDHIVDWIKPKRPDWMTEEEYATYPDFITVRECDITRETGANDQMVVVTTLMDAKEFTKLKLAKIYKKRWRIEIALKDLKDTFGLGHIAAKSPDMIDKIIWAHCLAHNCLRWHILNASILYSVPITSISVKGAATILSQYRIHILNSHSESWPSLFGNIYA